MANSAAVCNLVLVAVLWSVVSPAAADDRSPAEYKARVKAMFQHGYQNYMNNAFPMDELQPLSCQGVNTYGGYALTMIDSLDTLAVLGEVDEFRRAVNYIVANVSFSEDLNVSVFESTIRVLGGLLSGHQLAADPALGLVPGYTNGLLLKARDLADRLLPAFETPTGIPIGTVNLKHGVPTGETREANTAGAGSLVLEWGVLSRLIGDPKYETAAKKAMAALWQRKSSLGLVGGHINVDSGDWTDQTTGIGASVDSFYEYMFKGYLLLGYPEYLKMFAQAYQAVMKHQHKDQWYVDVNIFSGAVVRTVFNSLAAFWPGLQAMLGEVEEASRTLHSFFEVWHQFGFTPEGYDFATKQVNENQAQYPLRPEMAESAWYLYRATKDSAWQEAGMDMVDSIEKYTRVECGYAAVLDVRTHELEDVLDSFFFAETIKYFYMLFEDDVSSNPVLAAIEGKFILNTEGHILRFNESFYEETHSQPAPGGGVQPAANLTAHVCQRPSFGRRIAADGLEPPIAKPAGNPAHRETNSTLACSKCGHLVASNQPTTVDFPPDMVSHHYEVTAHGTLLVHKINDPSGKERELTMLPVDHEHVQLGSESAKHDHHHPDHLGWKPMKCGKCGHDLGFSFSRSEESKLRPKTFTGFYTSSLVRAVEPRLYPELPDVEMMMKFLAFVQHSLGHLDHTALSSAATDGRVIIVFEDPVSGFIDFLKTGAKLAVKQVLAPSHDAREFAAPSWPAESQHEILRQQLERSISGGLPFVQQQPLLGVLNKAMLVVLIKDLNSEQEEYPPARLVWTPPSADPVAPPVEIDCTPALLGTQYTGVVVNVTAVAVVAEPSNGCAELSGPREQWQGKAVLMQRGGCTFVVKMYHAQQAGAALAIVYNTVKGEAAIVMGSDPEHAEWEAALSIPSTMIALDDGEMITAGTTISYELTPTGGANAEEAAALLEAAETEKLDMDDTPDPTDPYLQPAATTPAVASSESLETDATAEPTAEQASEPGADNRPPHLSAEAQAQDSRYYSSEDP